MIFRSTDRLHILNSGIAAWAATLGDPCAGVDWTVIGPSVWASYLACINSVVADNPAGTDTASTFGSLSGTAKWAGGVLAPNGCIYGIPLNSTTVLKIDPATDTASTFGSLSGTDKWFGGVLAPNGYIYGIPYSDTTVLKIDPATDTASTFGSLSGTLKWTGGVLAPNGCIYGIPYSDTTVLKIDPVIVTPFSDDVALSGYFNKL